MGAQSSSARGDRSPDGAGRALLASVWFWTTADLEAKLRDFQTYFNAYRTHTGLGGRLPEPEVKGTTPTINIAS